MKLDIRSFVPAALLAAVLAAPGCIVIVDREYRSSGEFAQSDRGARLGVVLDSVDRATAAQLGLDRDRVTLISRVTSGSRADRAGLQRYDIVTAVGADDNAGPSRVRQAIRETAPGAALALTVLREGRPVSIEAVLD